MATGPEHYKAAELLIASQTLDGTQPDGSPIIRSDEPEVIALAQVHAMLALAAAVGTLGSLSDGGAQRRIADDAAWRDAAGVELSDGAR